MDARLTMNWFSEPGFGLLSTWPYMKTLLSFMDPSCFHLFNGTFLRKTTKNVRLNIITDGNSQQRVPSNEYRDDSQSKWPPVHEPDSLATVTPFFYHHLLSSVLLTLDGWLETRKMLSCSSSRRDRRRDAERGSPSSFIFALISNDQNQSSNL